MYPTHELRLTTREVRRILVPERRAAARGDRPAPSGPRSPASPPTKRAALVSVTAQELHARAKEVGMNVLEISAREVRHIVVGNPYAKKVDVARALVRLGFEDLQVHIPKDPPHPVLGYRPRDRYHLHMFDALAVALAIQNL